MSLASDIAACRICAEQFAQTATHHEPRPVVWFAPSARMLIASQAPGMRVHQSGIPFDDLSGDRLREWLGIDRATFYDRERIAIVPMSFCFPGYDRNGSDLPPPKICARAWRKPVLEVLANVELTVLVGGHALDWHLGGRMPVAKRVAGWRGHAPALFPLPHPSWRNTAWIRRNPWFETDLLPALRARVAEVVG